MQVIFLVTEPAEGQRGFKAITYKNYYRPNIYGIQRIKKKVKKNFPS